MSEETEEQEQNLGPRLDRIVPLFIQRRWLILATACTIALTTIVVLFQLPNHYTSEATIVLVQQQVPERYVVPTSTSDLSQALDGMVQEILSRPRLLSIIDEFGLYRKQKPRAAPDELIETIRQDVSIKPINSSGQREANSFKISFIAQRPELAQAVTTKLTRLFIEQNLKARADQANTTTVFLREQLDIAKTKLLEQEQRLRDFKMQYLGELPEQQQGNLGILAGLQNQLENVQASRNHAQQQRLYLQSLLSEYRRLNRQGYASSATGNGPVLTPLESAQRELERLKRDRAMLLAVYTLEHPDVLRKNQEIKVQEGLLDALKVAKTPSPGDAPQSGDAGATEEGDAGSAQLRSQLQANTLEIENLTKKEQKVREEVEQYRSRLNATPVREQQLTSMQRDYDMLRQSYGDLLKKEQESQLATNLEKRQEGQQFRLADPPNLPDRPSSPKRLKISVIALAVGILVGCALAFVLEIRSP